MDPSARYEPDERLDFDNVVLSGAAPEQLDLPDPPKSGFRLVLRPVTLEPGEERSYCEAWPFPSLQNTLVYAARIYTTTGLHHSNLVSLPIDQELGSSPYPECNSGAADPFSQIGEGIPDVLFANSTQVVGTEALVFPEGMAYRIHPEREVSSDIHLLNASAEPVTVEVVYDFYTMPEEALVEQLGPVVADNRDFEVPPSSAGSAETECRVFGGNVVSLMPHTHDYSTRFQVEIVDWDGAATEVYLEEGYDLESDIRVYDPPVVLSSDIKNIRFRCDYTNTKDSVLRYGLADQEMCILFGYVYPVETQFAAYQMQGDGQCTSVQIGLFQ